MPEISQAWLALIGALLGGTGLKFIEYWLSRPKIKDESATSFRNELRGDLKNLREEMRRERESGEEWREKYYKQTDSLYATKKEMLDLESRVEHLEGEVQAWKSKYYQLWQDMAIERDTPEVAPMPLPHPGSVEKVDSDPEL